MVRHYEKVNKALIPIMGNFFRLFYVHDAGSINVFLYSNNLVAAFSVMQDFGACFVVWHQF